MSRLTVLTTIAILSAAPAFASGEHAGGHDSVMAMGMPGDASQVDRTIEVTMKEAEYGEMVFAPSDMQFKAGETVRLVITNEGELEHEFVLDTPEKNQEHDDPNAIRLMPGASGEIVWTFANAGTFEYACLILGHYESGMHGPAVVN